MLLNKSLPFVSSKSFEHLSVELHALPSVEPLTSYTCNISGGSRNAPEQESSSCLYSKSFEHLSVELHALPSVDPLTSF